MDDFIAYIIIVVMMLALAIGVPACQQKQIDDLPLLNDQVCKIYLVNDEGESVEQAAFTGNYKWRERNGTLTFYQNEEAVVSYSTPPYIYRITSMEG